MKSKLALAAVMRGVAGALRAALPLGVRKRLAIAAGKWKAPGQLYFSTALLGDLAAADRNAFHRFLWSNHLAYAGTYEASNYFGEGKIESSRALLAAALTDFFRERGIDPGREVRSVCDVGCSMGHVLRYLETDVFPSATILRGLDIDRHAVETGSAYLASVQSKVELTAADMTEADRVLGDERYDVVLCCGVLMYLDESAVEKAMASMLSHARHVAGIIALAHQTMDNSLLAESETRASDGAFVHNIGDIVGRLGGKVVYSRREAPRAPGASAAYTILATPAGAAEFVGDLIASSNRQYDIS